MSIEIENIRKDIKMRVQLDTRLSNAWLLVYIVPIVAGISIGLSFLLYFSFMPAIMIPPDSPSIYFPIPFMLWIIILPILIFISFIVSIILIYKLIDRRNNHFKRQMFLFEDIIAAVRKISKKKAIDVEIGLSSCERTVRDFRTEETEKSSVLWAILSAIIFIADWYVRYFLMKDFYKHEQREDGFWEDLGKILNKLEINFSIPRRIYSTPNRSFVLYLILTIITFGIFGIYWLYILLKDPNEHFEYHTKIEDELLSQLESISV